MMTVTRRFVIWLDSIKMFDFIKKIKTETDLLKGSIILIVLVALIAVYGGALTGTHDFYPNDKVSSMNVKEAVKSSEDYPYWLPWMMGGIPSVHSFQNVSDYYFPNYFFKTLNLLGMPWFWNFVLHLFFGGVGVYLLLRRLDLDRFSSAISAMAFSIMPHVTAMLVYGHGSQVMTIAYIPWIFYGYLRLKENASLSNLGIFSLFVGLQILRGHPQIAYYTWLMLALCLLVDLAFFLINRKRDIKFFFFTVAGLALGLASSLSLYIPSLSYLPYSNRVSDGNGGMGFESATEYSFSFGEILTFFIPSYYGFGNQSYWGAMTMTNFPNYMGLLIVLFAVYGLIRYKWTQFKWFTLICFIVFLILSFGGDFYRFLYNNLFYFSKFRNPMYMLVVVQFCTVVLAAMGIKMMLEDLRNRKIFLPIFLGVFILFFSLIFVLSKGSFSNSVDFNDVRYKHKSLLVRQNPQIDLDIIDDYLASPEYSTIIEKQTKLVQSMIISDIDTLAVIVAFCFLGIIVSFFIYPSLNSSSYLMSILSALIALLVFYDIFIVNQKLIYPEDTGYLSHKAADNYLDFYDSRIDDLVLLKKTESYASPNVVKEIKALAENAPPFRILDPKRAHNNEWARHHVENILGYHPAHFSSYSIIEDSGYSDFLLNMMNIKYVIGEGDRVDPWPGLDRAFFIENILLDAYDDKDKRLNNLYNISGISPSYLSYVTKSQSSLILDWKDFDLIEHSSIYSFNLSESDSIIDIDNLNPNELHIEVLTSGPQFLAIGEIYYPNGWYASINGSPAKIFEVNDLIRGVYIDSEGSHSIKMYFSPSDLRWGSAISWISFFIIFIMIFSKRTRFS